MAAPTPTRTHRFVVDLKTTHPVSMRDALGIMDRMLADGQRALPGGLVDEFDVRNFKRFLAALKRSRK